MKTDRFSSASARAAAVLLAGLLVLAGLPAAGQIVIKFGGKGGSSKLAVALAKQVKEVKKRFEANRRALRGERGPGGKAYPSQEVISLIARTEQDLDQAIERVGEPDLDALRAWAAEEFGRIHGELAPPTGQTVASLQDLSTPRAVAVVATLGSLPRLASSKTEASQEAAITAEKADGLLDQAGAVVSRIWTLADRNDLEVDLWVGSTPEQKVEFTFWPKGLIRGTTPASKAKLIITNNKKGRVLRGLYAYKAAFGKGSVAQLIQFPVPSGAPEAKPSLSLDLVKESSFFCCHFERQICAHVDDKKQCR
ncbi:MAG TPA: hypothetical protein VF789_33700 [Thermoanaerobaculia bacterium]